MKNFIQKIISASGTSRRVDESQPFTDFSMPDGSRVNVIIPPCTLGGPVVLVMTNRIYQARPDAPGFVPAFTEHAVTASAADLAYTGLAGLDPSRPVKVIAIHAQLATRYGTAAVGPVELFVPVTDSLLRFVSPGPPQWFYKIWGYAEVPGGAQ